MGAVESWCFGGRLREGKMEMKPRTKTKRAGVKPRTERNDSGSSTSSKSSNEDGRSNAHRSVPQMIRLQAPEYSRGSLEAKYAIISPIGHGSTAVVYRCQNRRTGTIHACKMIDRRYLRSRHQDILEQFQVEIQVLQSMKHPNIIRIDDVYLTQSRICIVTEFMAGGELFDYIVSKGTLSEVEASVIVRKITSAIAYMHSCGVIHRDLKPENLMLTSKEPGAEVKIIDFGLAKFLDENAMTQSFLGTRGYLAPEMLQRQAYTRSVDMWALGVIVYVLLCGCLPFNDDGAKITTLKHVKAKFNLRFPRWANTLSPSARDLLRHLLDVDSTTRYTAEQVLTHPWVTGQRTPNQFLKSPNYLRSIKENHVHLNTPQDEENQDQAEASNRIGARRQSH